MEVERPQKTGQPPRIPIETWEAIFRYLTDASDLRNVSLTSRYMNEVVQPILYKRLYLDPNDYAIYTLLLLQGKLELRQKVIDLTLLPPTERPDGKYDCVDVEGLYGTLGLPHADWPPEFTSVRESLTWSPLGSPAISQRGGMGFEMYSRPIFHFLPRFPNLSTLRIIHDCIPEDFLTWISRLPQLRKLVLRDSALSSDLRALPERVELPLQELTMIRVYNKTFGEPHVTNHLCDTLIGGSPHLRSLVMDSFVERVVCNLLSEIEHPPPVEVFVSTGAGQQDLDTVTLRNVLNGLPTITTLTMARIPRELAPLLPRTALPNLRSVKGQIKSLGMFFRAERPIEDISVTDTPTSSGGVSWDTTIIQFFELLSASGTPLRSLTFCMGQWSEEVFLCVCQLFPKLKVLKIQCNSGTVDGVSLSCFFCSIPKLIIIVFLVFPYLVWPAFPSNLQRTRDPSYF